MSGDRPESAFDEPATQGGIWGKRSRKEIRLVVILAVVLVTVLVTALSVELTAGRRKSSSSVTKTRTVEPVVIVVTPEAKLEALRAELSGAATGNAVAALVLGVLAKQTVDSLFSGLDASAAPELRAAAWLVHTDTHNEQFQLLRRFALATIYYANGGSAWTDSTNWLSPQSHCDWKGVYCCGEVPTNPVCNLQAVDAVMELDLYKNNVTGKLQDVLALLQELQSLSFSDNVLTGEINTGAFIELPHLVKLYLQHNLLTGTIPTKLSKADSLGTFFFALSLLVRVLYAGIYVSWLFPNLSFFVFCFRVFVLVQIRFMFRATVSPASSPRSFVQ
jgi:hypothetical protein